MKKILVTILVISFSCKKETPKPIVADPPPPCTTADTNDFAGKFVYHTQPPTGGTVAVIFLKNNCPIRNQNYYVVKKEFAEYAQDFLRPNETLAIRDYTVLVNDSSNMGEEDVPESIAVPAFDIEKTGPSGIRFKSPKFYGDIVYYRLQ